MPNLTIQFPVGAQLPAPLEEDPDLARYLIIGALLSQREISASDALRLSGDSPQTFEEKLIRYGFGVPAGKTGDSGDTPNRWQALANQLEGEGFLDGRSEEAKRLLAESRLRL